MTEFRCLEPNCTKSTVPSKMYCAEHTKPDAVKLSDNFPLLDARQPSPIERALATQVAGDHYRKLVVQPAEFCHWNRIGKLEGDVIYYVTRWRDKNGVEDLRKARHTLDILIELETANRVTEKA